MRAMLSCLCLSPSTRASGLNRGKKVAFSTHGSNLQENILHMQYVREHETRITLLIVVFMVKGIAGKNM